MVKAIKLLVLTNLNVSNVHLMIAKVLNINPMYEVKFLNTQTKVSSINDSNWYEKNDKNINLSYLTKQKSVLLLIWNIIKAILKADLVICSGSISGFVRILKKPYIYFCYGSDLDQYSKYGSSIYGLNKVTQSKIRRFLYKLFVSRLYRYAIKGSRITVVAPYQYSDIKQLGYKRLGFFPHTLEEEYLDICLQEREQKCDKLRKQYNCEWIFFSSTRHEWSDNLSNENDYKGNDVIIKAFFFYTEQNIDKKAKLFLINKGTDIEKSKKLIMELNIEDKVVWLEPMNRKKLLEFYSGSHVCLDQFSKGCLALCAIEAMACGTPTVSYIGAHNEEVPFYNEIPPIFNNKDPFKISEYFGKIVNDLEFRKKIESQSFDWVKRNCSYDRFMEAFDSMINSIKEN